MVADSVVSCEVVIFVSRLSLAMGSEITCSSPNHFPRSTSLQRCEQNGLYGPKNQLPSRLHEGHLMRPFFFIPYH